jgi:hypothetical protein
MAFSSYTSQSKQEFLESKGKNFKKYIFEFDPSDKVKEYLEKFKEENLIPTIATTLLPVFSANAQEVMVSKLMEELKVPEERVKEVNLKIIAYINMFCNVLLDK